MKRVLLGAVVCVLLAACGAMAARPVVAPTASPTATVDYSARYLASPAGTPTLVPAVAVYCDAITANARFRGMLLLTIDPSAPRVGDVVTVAGSGLTPGRHELIVGSPGGPQANLGVVMIKEDGLLKTTFVMPTVRSGLCVTILLDSGTGAEAQSFVTP